MSVDRDNVRRVKYDRRKPKGSAPSYYMENVENNDAVNMRISSPVIDDPWDQGLIVADGAPNEQSFAFEVEDYAGTVSRVATPIADVLQEQ